MPDSGFEKDGYRYNRELPRVHLELNLNSGVDDMLKGNPFVGPGIEFYIKVTGEGEEARISRAHRHPSYPGGLTGASRHIDYVAKG